MATFAQGSFIIPEGTTPDMLRAKRERLAALMPRYGQAKYVGEGLGQLFSGIAQGRQNRAMDAYEGDQRKAAADMFNSRGPLSVLGMQPPAGPNQDIADEALAAIGQAPRGGNREAFIEAMMPHALRVSEQTGLDPRLVIAQAAQETGWGKSAPGNNFFGIKSHGKPGGNNLATNEVINGQTVRVNDSFRAYGGMGESADGYAQFLQENPRYRDMLSAGDLDGQVAALGRSGYATDPNYASSVGSIARSISLPSGGVSGGQGGTMSAQGRAPTGGADVSYLMQLAANPWLTQEQRAVVAAELQQATRQPETQFVKGIGLIDSQTGRVINDFGGAAGGTDGTEYGLQPQYGVDDQGNPVIIQIGKDGTATRTALPEGVTFQKEPIRIDGGTEWILLDPISRQPVGRIPKQLREAAAETAGGRIEGENAANAASNLSGNLAQADQSIALIDSIISDPALAGITGMVQGRLPPMTQAGTDLNVKIKQLQGKAFLEAFESLKGGGAITEREGVAATEAMARLDRAQSTAEYVAALTELRNIMQTGAERARASAGQSGTTPAATTGLTDDDMQWLGGN